MRDIKYKPNNRHLKMQQDINNDEMKRSLEFLFVEETNSQAGVVIRVVDNFLRYRKKIDALEGIS